MNEEEIKTIEHFLIKTEPITNFDEAQTIVKMIYEIYKATVKKEENKEIDIKAVLERADVEWMYNPNAKKRIVTSRNKLEPLTEEEQKAILRMCDEHEIEFRVG